jgi:hypothetical protein
MITNKTAKMVTDQPSYHPYYNVERSVKFTTGGVNFQIFVANGYNAGGLIGTECNGIVLVDLTKRDVIFDEWKRLGGCSMGSTPAQNRELERIVNMTAQELNDFMDNTTDLRLRYNPFEGKMLKAKEKKSKIDAGIAKGKTYKDARYMDAKAKARVSRAWELLIVKRLNMSPVMSPTEECALLGAFTDALYKHMSLHMGHIAHFNRHGFFQAQICNLPDLFRNVHNTAHDRNTYGVSLRRNDDYADLFADMTKVSKHYLPLLEKLKRGAEAQRVSEDITRATRLLESTGHTVTAQ